MAKWAFMLPVEITDSNNHLDTSLGNYTVATGTYESMIDVVAAVNVATSGAPTCDINESGRVVFTHVGTFTLDWSTGANSANTIGAVLGYDTSADDTGASSYTGDYQHTRAWYSERAPEFDSWDMPIVRGGKLHIAQSNLTKRVTNPNTSYVRETDFANIKQEKWHTDYAPTNEAFEAFYDSGGEGAGRGEECVMISNTSSMTREGLYVMLSPDGSLLKSSSRIGPNAPYFNVAIKWHKVSS